MKSKLAEIDAKRKPVFAAAKPRAAPAAASAPAAAAQAPQGWLESTYAAYFAPLLRSPTVQQHWKAAVGAVAVAAVAYALYAERRGVSECAFPACFGARRTSRHVRRGWVRGAAGGER